MLYLDQKTIQVFLYFLYNKDDVFGAPPLNLCDFLTDTKLNLVYDLNENDLDDIFYFKLNIPVAVDMLRTGDEDYHYSFKSAYREAKEEREKFVLQSIINLDEKALISVSDFISMDMAGIDSVANVLKIHCKDEMELEKFLKNYIRYFAEDKLYAKKNYCSFQTDYRIVCIHLIDYYKRYGMKFIASPDIEEKRYNGITFTAKRQEVRFYEMIFYLASKNYLKIENAFFDDENKPNVSDLNLLIALNKSPQEIMDIESYWTSYGDIRINREDGVAYYKNNRYPFKSTKGRAFQLLSFLVKNHGQKLPTERAYHAIVEEDDLENIEEKEKQKIMKAAIKDYVKEIKKNLKISEDKNSTIDIMVMKDSVMMISNPPVQKA
ncbi:MAG: hypothetical protein ACQEP5_09310 [Actinomycetota bacterium]